MPGMVKTFSEIVDSVADHLGDNGSLVEEMAKMTWGKDAPVLISRKTKLPSETAKKNKEKYETIAMENETLELGCYCRYHMNMKMQIFGLMFQEDCEEFKTLHDNNTTKLTPKQVESSTSDILRKHGDNAVNIKLSSKHTPHEDVDGHPETRWWAN